MHQWLAPPALRILGLVGNHNGNRAIFEQYVGAFKVMGLSEHQIKATGITYGVGRCIDVGCQAAAVMPMA